MPASAPDKPPASLDLYAVEGEDVGSRFTLDGAEVLLGRKRGEGWDPSGIALHDRSVSSRQARLRATPDGWVLQHLDCAKNPTRINGLPVEQQHIVPGDRIGIGRVVLEVRQRDGPTLGQIDETLSLSPPGGEETVYEPATQNTLALGTGPGRPDPWGRLIPLEGALGDVKSLPLRGEVVTLGRAESCDVVFRDPSVSRLHAELRWIGDQPCLVHLGGKNVTRVSEQRVADPRTLRGNETIRLAGKVRFRVELEARPSALQLLQNVADTVSLEKRAESASLLDIDIVDSSGMKRGQKTRLILTSFDRYRDFARRIVEEFGGSLLNCNGDELMCFFTNAEDALRAASAEIARLPDFNARENLLPTPFRIRQGLHSGKVLVDWERRQAFSQVLDVAGHLQKQAQVNDLLLTQDTFDQLPPGLPLEPAGVAERHPISVYRLSALL